MGFFGCMVGESIETDFVLLLADDKRAGVEEKIYIYSKAAFWS